MEEKGERTWRWISYVSGILNKIFKSGHKGKKWWTGNIWVLKELDLGNKQQSENGMNSTTNKKNHVEGFLGVPVDKGFELRRFLGYRSLNYQVRLKW